MPDLTDQHLKMMRPRDAARAWMQAVGATTNQ